MSDDEVRDALTRRGLWPPRRPTTPAEVGLVPDDGVDPTDRYRGALVAGAVGDALGRPVEGVPRLLVGGPVTEFRPWRGWQGGPVGTITDDTQLTIVVAECLVANDGVVDPDDLTRRLVEWLPDARGIGHATRTAVERLASGVPWWDAGEPSAGNGAAMRAAPVGLVLRADPDELRRQAALSALPTHADPMAVVSTVAMAHATAWCACRAPGSDPTILPAVLAEFVADLHDPGHPERRHDRDLGPVRLVDRLGEVPDLLDASSAEAFDHFHNGAFVLESLPAAVWCFLHSPTDPEQVLVTAAGGGHDADTVASMAGDLAGAFCGETALPSRWVDDLEDLDRLRRLADDLLTLSGTIP